MANLLLDQETINKEEVDMLLEGKSAKEIAEYMKEKAEKQRAKEAEFRKTQEQEKKKQMLEDKVKEGEKLVMAGIITKEEFESIKAKYQAELEQENKIEEKQVEIKLNNGVTLQETEKKEEEKPKKTTTRKKTTKKETPQDDNKGDDK